jgi:hypothetical protein
MSSSGFGIRLGLVDCQTVIPAYTLTLRYAMFSLRQNAPACNMYVAQRAGCTQ